jgi:soluble lytic murein transglycosylase-like protein
MFVCLFFAFALNNDRHIISTKASAWLVRVKNMIFKYFVISVLLLCGVAHADPLDHFIDSYYEQKKATEWVEEATQGQVPNTQASKIVKEAYANAFSRHIKPSLVLAVIKTESTFKVNAKSNHNARGLMQVIPRWHKEKIAGRNIFSVPVAIEVGTWVLSDCLKKHKGSVYKGLSCYSGGGGKAYYAKVMKHQYALTQSLKPSGELVAKAF